MRVGFYQASSLCEVGLTIYFGHNGQCCPLFSTATRLTVVDITGVHCLRVGWCRCQVREDHMQLLLARLYPASTASPRTAFTFRVLDDFLVSNKVSGCPAQSYYEHIRRVTNSAFPDQVPVSGTKRPLCLFVTHAPARTAQESCCASAGSGEISSCANGMDMGMTEAISAQAGWL